MEKDSGIKLKSLKVDGGACMNNYLMQFQSDLLNCEVLRPEIIETTAMGAGYLAGLQSNIWDKDQIIKNQKIDRSFNPTINDSEREKMYRGWKKAVNRTFNWIEK